MKYLGVKREGKGIVAWQFLSAQLEEYARVDHTHDEYANSELVQQLKNEIDTLKEEVATLKEQSGKVKNIQNNSWLDVGVYPNGQMPSNTTNKLAFEEEA